MINLVNRKIDELEKVESEKGILEGKLSILRKVQSDVLENTNAAVIALQEENPSSQLVYLIKKYSQEFFIPVAGFEVRSGGPSAEGALAQNATYQIRSGNLEEVGVIEALNYIDAILESVPLTKVEKADISLGREGLVFQTEGNLYWAKLPTELPPLIKPIKELTSEEEQLLQEIVELSKPEFSTLDPTDPQYDRINPFIEDI